MKTHHAFASIAGVLFGATTCGALLVGCGSPGSPRDPPPVLPRDEAAAAGSGSALAPAAMQSAGAPNSVSPADASAPSSDMPVEQGLSNSAKDGADGFALLFRDDFDTLDSSRWQVMTHSWDTNLALFSTASPSIADGQLVLRLLPAPVGTVDTTGASKSFLGAEVRSRQTLTYGRVRARVKFARGSAVVSSLVTLYTPYPADDWNELDIETLGRDPSHTQFNTQVYLGPPVARPAAASVTPTQNPVLTPLAFDASADFHVYTIEWTPESARFLVDEQPAYSPSQNIEQLGLAQNVLLTIWASSSDAWAGPVTADTSTAAIIYDWVEVYSYTAMASP